MKLITTIVAFVLATFKGLFGIKDPVVPLTPEEELQLKIAKIEDAFQDFRLVHQNSIDSFADVLIAIGIKPEDAKTWSESVHDQSELIKNLQEQVDIGIETLKTTGA